MGKSTKYYAFVGTPCNSLVYSQIIEDSNSQDKIQGELDNMIDFVAGAHKERAIWATYPTSRFSFGEACKKFGKLMDKQQQILNYA